MPELIVSKRFADERHDICEFVTPNAYEIKQLYKQLQRDTKPETAIATWQYLNEFVLYPTDMFGRFVDDQVLSSFGKTYTNPEDFWHFPFETAAKIRSSGKTHGDCLDMSTLFVSILRNQMEDDEIFVVIGKLKKYPNLGHAWVKMAKDADWYYVDPTVQFGRPLEFGQYEEYIEFNDQQVVIYKSVDNLLRATPTPVDGE